MKTYINKILILSLILISVTSCEVQEFSDLNNAEVDAFENNLTRGDLQDLVGGILYSSRLRLGTYLDDNGILGREYYRFSASDPRFTSDMLGKEDLTLDNNTFYITAPWGSRYRTVKNANLILGFLDGQDLSAQFSDQEITATKGFLKTFIGYELLLNLNLTYQNGIRIDVADENNLGPFLSYEASLAEIKTILENGAADLQNGGSDFPFILSRGFSGFEVPTTFLKFNKAISARVAAYQGDASGTLAFLDDSFLNLSGEDLNTGVYYNFSLDQTDLVNPLFVSIDGITSANSRVVQSSFITDAESDDNRLSKVVELETPLSQDGLSGDYAVFRYTSLIDDIPIIRNEELILYTQKQILRLIQMKR
jgi:hypothetical protein